MEDKSCGNLDYLPITAAPFLSQPLSRDARADLVSAAFKNHAAEFVGAFTVIAPTGIRIRPSSPPTGGIGP